MPHRQRRNMEILDALQVYDEFYTRIFRYVLHRVGDVETARDITSEVFLKMVRHRLRFRFTNAPVSAWLFRIAGNEVSSFYRKERGRKVQLEDWDDGGLPALLKGDLEAELSAAREAVDRNNSFFRVCRRLRKLPEKYQEVIVLHYLEEQTVPQIARLLGKKEGTVKSLISRGIAKLKAAEEREIRAQAAGGILVEEPSRKGVNA